MKERAEVRVEYEEMEMEPGILGSGLSPVACRRSLRRGLCQSRPRLVLSVLGGVGMSQSQAELVEGQSQKE